MYESIASRTALRVAIRRAEHQILDHPRVFEDDLAVRIIGPENIARIQPGVILRMQRLSRSFRAFMAVRSRYAEDELAKAVKGGVRQYVVLGAGLDTFAFRNPYPGLRVFEVDHPATQAWKLEQLEAACIHVPDQVHFVSIHFERQTLEEGLRASAFRMNQPAFFSWLGVVPYLTRGAFEQTMSFVAAMRDSAIALDYAVSRTSLNAMECLALDALSERVAAAGEPFQLFLDPAQLHAELVEMGFHEIEDLGRDQINKRYFYGRPDDFRVKGNLGHLLRASTHQVNCISDTA